jgi:hypothetical protein
MLIFVSVSGRALFIAARSRVIPIIKTPSVRRSQVLDDYLNLPYAELKNKGRYLVVKGPEDAGKTTLLETVLNKRPSVLPFVGVAPGTKQDAITGEAYRQLTGSFWTPIVGSYEHRAIRVDWWHNLLFRRPPTLVFALSERGTGKEYAEITGAARRLASAGVCTIIDAPPNALAPTALQSRRAIVCQVGLLCREQLLKIPEYRQVSDRLKTLQIGDVTLDDMAWMICGGLPILWDDLMMLHLKYLSDDLLYLHVSHCLLRIVNRAIDETQECLKPTGKELREVLIREHRVNITWFSTPQQESLLTSLSRALRYRVPFYVPASPAAHLVIVSGLNNVPNLHLLTKFVPQVVFDFHASVTSLIMLVGQMKKATEALESAFPSNKQPVNALS